MPIRMQDSPCPGMNCSASSSHFSIRRADLLATILQLGPAGSGVSDVCGGNRAVRTSCGEVEAGRLDVRGPQADAPDRQRGRAENRDGVVDARSVVGHFDEDGVRLAPVADVGSSTAMDDCVRGQLADDEPGAADQAGCEIVVEQGRVPDARSQTE
jgi:hypothetical protein